MANDEHLLDNYVEEHGYSLGSMALASTTIAFMRFAKTFTDIGQLGNGVLIEGGWRGAGEDALRALNLVGAAGAVAGRAGRLLKVVQAANANTCAWVSQTNELRLSGQRFLVTLDLRINVNFAHVVDDYCNTHAITVMKNVIELSRRSQETRKAP